MTKDLAMKHNTTFTGYAGLQAGAWNNISTTGAILGGTAAKGKNYLKAEIGLGTAAQASVRAGHEFDIGKNMGFDLSVGAKAAHSFVDKYKAECKYKATLNDAIVASNSNFEQDASSLQADVEAKLKFNLGRKVQLGAGILGGVRRDNGNASILAQSDMTINADSKNVGMSDFDAVNPSVMAVKSKTHGYVTPIFTAKADLGKIQLGADFQGNGALLKAAYKF